MYRYKLEIEGQLFDFNPINSGDSKINWVDIEFPFWGKTIELQTDVVITKSSVSLAVFNAIRTYLIDTSKTICYLIIYNQNNEEIHREWFNGYNIAEDRDNQKYTIATKPLNDYIQILRNFETEFNIYSKVTNANEITINSPSYYTGDFLGCIPIIDIIEYIARKYFEGFTSFECKFLKGDSYVTGSDILNKMYVTHISNIKEAVDNSSYNKATVFNTTPRKIFEYIAKSFDARFTYSDGVLYCLEMHEVRDIDINRGVVIDLLSMHEKYSRNKNRFSYISDQFPERYKLGYKSYDSPFFADAIIQYDPNEAIHSDNAEESTEIDAITDIYGIYANESQFGADEMVVLLADADTENDLLYDTVNNTVTFNSTYSVFNGEFNQTDDSNSNRFLTAFRGSNEKDPTLQKYIFGKVSGSANIVTSDVNFTVTNGDIVSVSYWQEDELFDLEEDITRGIDNVSQSSHFDTVIYVGDSDNPVNGVPNRISSRISTKGYRLADFNTRDRTNMKFEGHVSFNLTVNSDSNNAVIVFEIRQGNTTLGTYQYSIREDKIVFRNEDVYYKSTLIRDIYIYLFQSIDYPNYYLRPSNLIRLFHNANMYFLEGNVQSNVGSDNGKLTAYTTRKIKKGEEFTVPYEDIKQLDVNGGVISVIGNDGEILDATYDLHTKNLTVVPIFNRYTAGGNDITFFSFFRQVGISIIDNDAKTVSAVISREGDITNVTSQRWEFSYKARAFPYETDFTNPVTLPVLSATGDVAIWTITITVAHMLSLQIKRNDNTTVDVFKATTISETGTINTNIGSTFFLNSNSLSQGTCNGFVNFNLVDASQLTALECEINQESIDLSEFDNLISFSSTSLTTPDDNEDDDILLNEIIFSDNGMDYLGVDNNSLTTLDGMSVNTGVEITAKNNNFSRIELQKILYKIASSLADFSTVDLTENKACLQRPWGQFTISGWQHAGITSFLGDKFTVNDGRGITLRVTSTSSGEPTSWVIEDYGKQDLDVWIYEDSGGGLPILNYMQFDGINDVLSVSFNLKTTATYEFYMRFNDDGGTNQKMGCIFDATTGTAGAISFGIQKSGTYGSFYYWFYIGGSNYENTANVCDHEFHKYTIKNKSFYVDDVLMYDGSDATFTSGSSSFAIGANRTPSGYQDYAKVDMCWFKYDAGFISGDSNRVIMPRDSSIDGAVLYRPHDNTFFNVGLVGGGEVNVVNLSAINSEGESIVPAFHTPWHDVVFNLNGDIAIEIFDRD